VRRLAVVVVTTIVTSLALPAGVAPAASEPSSRQHRFEVTVLSSRPDQVSGGDALVEVTVPRTVPLHKVEVQLNGEDVSSVFSRGDGRTLVGLVDGLVEGENELEVQANGRGQGRPPRVRVELVNHPSSGPIFSGPQQQPFVCATARATFEGRKLLGQPLVDNQDQFGIPVAAEDAEGNYPQDGRGYPTAEAEIVGWSKDCAADTQIGYIYRTTGGQFRWLDDPTGPLPDDIATTTTLEGDTVPFVVRWERGTINRFIYSVAMLAPVGETDPLEPDDALWNERLVLSFQGGVAIGHHQGTTSTGATLPADLLGQGYAVQWSSGNRTNTHYNLQLGGETALMVKERFIETHGVPWYTAAVGGSGGAIQQYVYAQNHPGLIDAGIPQYSYSDMITQTIHVGDCELLEHYFDATARDNPRWRDPEVRQAIMGLNASAFPQNLSQDATDQFNQLYALYQAFGYQVMDRDPASPAPALTECRRAWVGLTPLTLNPSFTNVSDIDKLAQGVEGVEWTHAGDLVNIYGVDETGFARRPWDNVGVQYGLQALVDGVITPEEFLDLNAQVGGWRRSADLVDEGFPFAGPLTPENFDPWSSRNMNLSPDGGITPAPRTEGNIKAINAAYTSGMVFDGDIDIPIIDWRHYLEDDLDMHHSHQSFATRQRMLDVDGDAGNQVIWFTDGRPARAFDQTPMAFAVIDEWMANLRDHPERSVAENRPAAAVDSCFDVDGNLLAQGEDVWAGVLDDQPDGQCTSSFPIYSSSRRVAGGPYRGGVFKCQTQPVATAIEAGTYGDWVPNATEQARLEEVFPEGVCDWSLPDVGRPTD
jgi:hypothetical protein